MGRRGPRPEPAAVKIAKGNPGRRPVGTAPAVDAVAREKVTPPAWLTGDGLKIWQRLAPRLAAMKLLGVADAETFARYCRNFARWLKMQTVLDREGETYESESQHGKLKRAHPAYLIGDRLERQLASAEANFGLNPAERQRIYAARAAAGKAPDLFHDEWSTPAPRGRRGDQAPRGGDEGAAEDPGTDSPVGFLN